MARCLCIFGASGATGVMVTRLAAERGIDVVAFVRSEAARDTLPARLTDGSQTGCVRSGEELGVGARSRVSRADLGRFILDELDAQRHVGKKVVVGYWTGCGAAAHGRTHAPATLSRLVT